VLTARRRQPTARTVVAAHVPLHRWLRRALPPLVAVAVLVSLIVVVNPRLVGDAAARFNPAFAVPLVALAGLYYGLQGLRWHLLLRAVGVRQPLARSEAMNLAGQAVSATFPLGDLARALLASRSSGAPFGTTAATVTVQELSFTVCLVLMAAPGLVQLPGGVVWVAVAMIGVAAVVAILSVPRVFSGVRRLVAATPVLRRLTVQVDTLQGDARRLLRSPEVLAGTVLDLARAAVAATAVWVILLALHIGGLTWWAAALALSVSYIGGAISLLPGGLGANEASFVGILTVLGVPPAPAVGAAIMASLWQSGSAVLGGFVAYAALRRPLRLSGLTGLLPAASPSVAPTEFAGTTTVPLVDALSKRAA
jgi:glycosyltransferase 2 family protein